MIQVLAPIQGKYTKHEDKKGWVFIFRECLQNSMMKIRFMQLAKDSRGLRLIVNTFHLGYPKRLKSQHREYLGISDSSIYIYFRHSLCQMHVMDRVNLISCLHIFSLI